MTRQQVARTTQSSLNETPLVSGILPRAAVRPIPETGMQPQEDIDNSIWRESRFHHDFSQVPVHSAATPLIQPKLTIGSVGDKYEQEADRVAHQVVSQINAPGNQTVQREEMPEKDDEEKLKSKLMVQRQSDGRSSYEDGMAATPELEASIQQARGSGQPLSGNIRKPMEQAFGFDFSRVKVHTDAQSERLNRSIQAKAFTTGQDIFFRQGAYSPGSRGGQELIAHELTHVVQQNGQLSQQGTVEALSSFISTTPSQQVQRNSNLTHPGAIALDLARGNVEDAKFLAPRIKKYGYLRVRLLYVEYPRTVTEPAQQNIAEFALENTQQNDVDTLEAIMQYFQQYPQEERVLQLAQQKLVEKSMDIAAAKVEMAVLMKYNFDPQLQEIVGKKTEQLSEAAIEQEKKRAQSARETIQQQQLKDFSNAALERITGKAKKKPQNPKEITASQAIKTAKEAEQKRVEQARATIPAQITGEYESIIETATPQIGENNVRWLIETVPSPDEIKLLIPLFQNDKTVAQQPVIILALNLSKNIKQLKKVVEYIQQAHSQGLESLKMQPIFKLFLTLKVSLADSNVLLVQFKMDSIYWSSIMTFIETSSDTDKALTVVIQAIQRNLSMSNFLTFISKESINNIEWALELTGYNLIDAEKAIDLLAYQNITQSNVTEFLKKTNLDNLKDLIEKIDSDKPNPNLIKNLLKQESAHDLLLLLNQFSSHVLKKYIIDHNNSAATLRNLLGYNNANATKIQLLLTWVAEDGNQLNTLFGLLNDADVLNNLRSTYIGKTPEWVVRAHLAKGSWNKGTFPDEVESILYHYQKHVINDAPPVPPANITVYTTDATNCRIANLHLGVLRPDGNFVIREAAPGTKGGHFTPTGKILTFWYVP